MNTMGPFWGAGGAELACCLHVACKGFHRCGFWPSTCSTGTHQSAVEACALGQQVQGDGGGEVACGKVALLRAGLVATGGPCRWEV